MTKYFQKFQFFIFNYFFIFKALFEIIKIILNYLQKDFKKILLYVSAFSIKILQIFQYFEIYMYITVDKTFCKF